MTKMSNLPKDLLEEILFRVPVKSMREVRSTCRKWNTLSKKESFSKKHLAQAAAAAAVREGEFLAIVMIRYSLYLLSVNVHGTLDGSDPSLKLIGKLINLNDLDEVALSQVCHCEGLLLCTTEDYSSVVVWNPFTGLNQWIFVEPTSALYDNHWYSHALGYDKSKSCRTHKILRFTQPDVERPVSEIYDLNSNSWKVLDVTADSGIEFYDCGVSLKGDTYWFAQEKSPLGLGERDILDFFICFDFTTERFGPRLLVPFHSYHSDTATLSSVREEQLAMLFQKWDYEVEIWVTTKVEPSALSWSKFLVVDMKPFIGFQFYIGGRFLIDEEKKTVIVFDRKGNSNRNIAYIIGENGYSREVDLEGLMGERYFPFACSYVPRSVQISINPA